MFTTAGTMFLILLGEFDYDEMKQVIAEIPPRCPAEILRRGLSDSPRHISLR